MPSSQLHTASDNSDTTGVADGLGGYSLEANEDMDQANTGLLSRIRTTIVTTPYACFNQTRSTLLRFLGLLSFGFPWRAEPLEHDLEAGTILPHGRVEGSSPAITRGASSAALAQEASEVDKKLGGILNQCFSACLPTCAMSYPVLKDAPDSVKLVMYGGLAFITLIVYIGMLSKLEARAKLAIRLVSCTAVTLLTFNIASQLSISTYVVALTALVGGTVNLIILLLPF